MRGTLFFLAFVVAASACSDSDSDAAPITTAPAVAPATDGQFVIGALPDDLEPLHAAFAQHVAVFGIDIVATATTDPADVLHAANVLAAYLDNDEDGMVDDQRVIDVMAARRATLLMAATPAEFESLPGIDAIFEFVGTGGQDLYGSETNRVDGFDASLEEVHHLIYDKGWAEVHPEALAPRVGSHIADAMDAARGGRFPSVPDEYPEGAWYTYDDRSCDYACMVTEYAYWAHTSLLGAQVDPARAQEISNEWRLSTPEALRTGDPAATALFEDPALGLPTRLPDGSYRS